jgi:hypothetical protein
MSLKNRWYMQKDENGKYFQHNPKWCNCNICFTTAMKLKILEMNKLRSDKNEIIEIA